MSANSKRKPRSIATSAPDTTKSKRAPKREGADLDVVDLQEAPPAKVQKKGEGDNSSPKAGDTPFAEGVTPLQRWLQVTPRGPARYRATGSPEFFFFDTKLDEDDASERDRLTASPMVEFMNRDLGPKEWKEISHENCYTFPRKRLGEAMKRMFGLIDPGKKGDKSQKKNKPASAEGSPIQHGDIVGIDADYRCVGWHIAYGPPEDMWLIRTGSEYGYCLPLEFCDAPPGYYGPDREQLHEFAFPSPALFLNLPSVTLEEAKTAVSEFVSCAYELPSPPGKKKPQGAKQNKPTSDWTWENEPQEPFAADGSDGFFVFDSDLEESRKKLPIGREGGRWSFNQTDCELVFTDKNGKVYAKSTDVMIAGSYESITNTWMWGWNNPSIRPELTMSAKAPVEGFVLKNLFFCSSYPNKFCLRLVPCGGEWEGWGFAALMNKVLGGVGVYRGPEGHSSTFVMKNMITVE